MTLMLIPCSKRSFSVLVVVLYILSLIGRSVGVWTSPFVVELWRDPAISIQMNRGRSFLRRRTVVVLLSLKLIGRFRSGFLDVWRGTGEDHFLAAPHVF